MIKTNDFSEIAYDIRSQNAALRVIQDRIEHLMQAFEKKGSVEIGKWLDQGHALNEIELLKYFTREYVRPIDIERIDALVNEHAGLVGRIEENQAEVPF